MRPERKRSIAIHSLGVMLVTVALVVGCIVMVMRVATPPPPSPTVPARAALGPPLTKRLALVLMDGIRFDVATDGQHMPRLAERLRSHASAELWAEPISMTSSAALVFGTGAHSGIDQAIRNETAQPTLFEDLFTLARKAHLRTATVGDPVWTGLFPNAWDVTRDDPHNVAIGLSDDDVAFAAAYAIQKTQPPVDVGVYHFATPDHMAHGHGVGSPTYDAYIKSFDARLAEFIDRFPPDTTLVIVGDHGATMAGIHGSDTPEQRRTVMVAQGPGIVEGPRSMPRADDVDIAPTIAALLGIPTPRHARGHPLVSWLAVGDDVRATMACANVRDLAALVGSGTDPASLAPACDPQRSPQERIDGSQLLAHALDARGGEQATASEGRGVTLSLIAAGLTALLSFLLFFETAPTAPLAIGGLAFALAVGVSVFITANVERLPGVWLTPARGALYVFFNAPLVLWVLRPVTTSRLLERASVLAPLVLPGILVLTETHSALTEAYVLSAVLVVFAFTRGVPTGTGYARAWANVTRPRMALYWPALLVVSVVCIDAGNFTPEWLSASPRLQHGMALGSIGAFAAIRHLRLRPPLVKTIVCTAVAVLSLELRRSAPAAACLIGWAAVSVAAGVAIRRRDRIAAELLAFGAYAWVSRDLEVPLFLASYLVAMGFGEALGKDLGEQPEGSAAARRNPRVLVLSVVAFVFAWGFVQVAAIQLGIHFMHLDFGAGAFRDAGVSMPRIVVALVYKYAVARGFLLFGALLPLSRSMRLIALRSLVALYAVRATVLVASLEAGRNSHWTPIWVTSELPHVLLALVVVAIAYVALREPASLREVPAHV